MIAVKRAAIVVLLALAVWGLTAVVLILLGDGCRLDYVLPWYSTAYDNCQEVSRQ